MCHMPRIARKPPLYKQMGCNGDGKSFIVYIRAGGTARRYTGCCKRFRKDEVHLERMFCDAAVTVLAWAPNYFVPVTQSMKWRMFR